MRSILVAVIAIILILTAEVIAQDDEIINFPDPYFKKVLVNMGFYEQPRIDKNGDGEIQYTEAAAYDGVLWLSFGGDSLTDLTGIKAFINVQTIWLEFSQGIKEIDLSGMVNLRQINFESISNLTVLNISGCKNLGSVQCSYNKLRYINAANCSNLTNINSYENMMEDINLTGCYKLQLITSTNGNLTKLDIKECLALEGMNIVNNQIEELDISNLPKFKGVSCSNNKLKVINASNLEGFNRLEADNNLLESVNVRNGNNQAMKKFKTFGNPNLKCITVDDATYSKENWKDIDEWTEFSEDCSNSINESNLNSFKVFPNPANNTVLIERNGVEGTELKIVDITGRICLSRSIQFGETQIQIDISKLSSGKYIIEINNETGSLIVE